MTSLVLSILNGSSSYLQIRRKTTKAWMSLIFVKISSHLMALAALEHLKKLIDNVVTALAPSFFYWIFIVLAGNKDNHNISYGFKIGPDQTLDCGGSCP